MTYKTFIPVENRQDIPNGTQYIIVNADEEQVKQTFINKGIMVNTLEGGFETEELLIDEGTRAKYRVHIFDNQIRISSYWGITQQVKSTMTVWAGYAAASAYDTHSFNQVIYREEAKRPKRVFDYAVQIIESSGLNYNLR